MKPPEGCAGAIVLVYYILGWMYLSFSHLTGKLRIWGEMFWSCMDSFHQTEITKAWKVVEVTYRFLFFFFFFKFPLFCFLFYLVLLFLYTCVRAKFVQLFATLWTVAHQGSLSMGFPSYESWSGLPCPPGDLPDSGVKPSLLRSPALAGEAFTANATWEAPILCKVGTKNIM